ncbi:hypothetical protein [Pseudobutyrivibrio xylanivorans]|uniref:Uncharacterized protein n=3 Tax=Pseudobutyrivibrio xylanivorans DSM 14809 TaxID=1123012 RepID=A0A1M6LME7_PSEXY|nr:hypothetical protein [Pseudobutyrivibrio xylanivorans]SHJ72343.1 hypothetical protein SAMN02745725_03141 [Pseudobutyrivibrio xylanivorans DSM 14809]
MLKITNENLQNLAELYNQHGKDELYNKLKKDYKIKNPTCVFKRMKTNEMLGFDTALNKFTFHKCVEDEVFMSFDELCAPHQEMEAIPFPNDNSKAVAMDKLIQELIGDKLLEISKYVNMNVIDRTIIIDQTSLHNDGYQIIAH